jgi:nucleoside-diphosphate-sugar epimerase
MGNIINKQNLFLFGYGYVAQFFCDAYVSEYNHIGYSFHKSEPKYLGKPLMSIAYEFNKIKNDILDLYDCFLVSIPPNYAAKSDPVIEQFFNYFSNRNKSFNLIYLSATSVYGDHNGQKVNEESQLLAKSENGIARIACEGKYLTIRNNKNANVNILRLAGIYGDQRNAIEGILKNKIICNYDTTKIISRTHVKDIVNIINQIFLSNVTNQIFNVADDNPAKTQEVNDFICDKILEIARLVVKPKQKVFRHSSYALDNKIVDNAKLKQLLNYKFIYPSYKEGLLDIAKNIKSEFN